MRKKQLCTLFMIILSLSIAGVNMNGVSAVGLDTISVDPDIIVDTNLSPGENFTVSIYTNYTGGNVWGYEFTLTYNPDVLHGGINYADTWAGDGSTTEWNTTYTPHYDSQKVYVNSSLKTLNMQGDDSWVGDGGTVVYVTTGSPVVEFPPSEEVRVDSVLKTKNTVNTDTWAGDGGTTEFFTTEQPLVPGSEIDKVWLNVTDTWTADGIDTFFNTTYTPIIDFTEIVRLDGILMNKVDNYTINYLTGAINFTKGPPSNGAAVKAQYKIRQVKDVDYTINYDTGNITFTVAPPNGEEVRATYKYGHYEIHYLSGTITFNSNSVPGASLDINVLYTYKVYTITYAFDPFVGIYATITFEKAPGASDTIDVEYLYGGVDNGDLITGAIGGIVPGLHNVTEGKLKLTTAFMIPGGFFLVSGPGILANVTFQVVGIGKSDITLGPETRLMGWMFDIIDGGANPNQLEHGYFRNTFISDIRGPGVGNPPDGVVDGWDYGFIGLYFGKTTASPEWSIAYIADTRGPGVGNPPDGVVDGWDYGYAGLQFGSSV